MTHPGRLLIIIVAMLAAACSGVDVTSDARPPSSDDDGVAASTVSSSTTVPSSTTSTAPPTTAPPTTTVIDSMLSAMSTEEKIGQLLMPVLAGTTATAPTPAEAATNQARAGWPSMAEVVAELHLGGVLYLGPNIADAAQVAALSDDLQQAFAAGHPGGPGLFVAVDQEGGRVARLVDGITAMPPARSFTPDTEAARDANRQLAVEVEAQGINVVFAPVADLVAADNNQGVIANRSFSGDPSEAAEMVRAVIAGLQGGGVAATVKHWPGHGDTSVDSHRQLPTIDVDLETWRTRERVPFAAAVAADVDMVMVGHLAMPAIDPSGQPATVSSAAIDGLLREGLGFDGVVVTDALDMGAVSSFDNGELAVGSVLAGADLLLAMPDVVAARDALLAAVSDGRLTVERLDLSVERILRLKETLGLL